MVSKDSHVFVFIDVDYYFFQNGVSICHHPSYMIVYLFVFYSNRYFLYIYSIYSHVQRSVISRKSVIMMIQLSLGVLPSQHTIIPVTTRRQYHFRVRRDL